MRAPSGRSGRWRRAAVGLVVLSGLAGGLGPARSSAAQSLGTFRWQLQPFCNVLTLDVTVQGPAFVLTGFDDVCGQGRLVATGAGAQNLDGTFHLRLSVATLGAQPHDLRADLQASLSGSWRDTFGNSGSFAFSPALPASGDVLAARNLLSGIGAIEANTGGFSNTAVGHFALQANTTGAFNSVLGGLALSAHPDGSRNTAVGQSALRVLTAGQGNTALGQGAGDHLRSGDENVYIASPGPEVSGTAESRVIRIGSGGNQTVAYVAGVADSQVNGDQVCVASDGRLGVCPFSSVHFKEDVAPVAGAGRLLELTPVAFRYRPGVVAGPPRARYGLLAEEVAGLYPDLARLDAEGTPVGVHYEALPVLLLAELQRQARELDTLRAELARLRAAVEEPPRPVAAPGLAP